MTRRLLSLALLATFAAATTAAPAAAEHRDDDHGKPDKSDKGSSQGAQVYKVDLDPLNESGVDGKAVLVLRDGTLRVNLHARGLVPGMLHPQHIHGLDGSENATCPPASAAGDDGVLTIGEGMPFYGPVLQPLMPFPMADNGTVNYHETFEVSGDLSDLSDEVIVLHGKFVDGEYVATLPVACGEIS